MNELLDRAAAIRQGEELDLPKLEAYLREHLPQFPPPPTVEQFPHGHSNLTYLVRSGTKELVLRRPLGTTLGYWVQADDPEPLLLARFGPTMLPGSLTRREIVERYEHSTGRTVSRPHFYYCFGLFKIAVIIQQIYARFAHGKTRDPRFAHLNEVVAVMSQQAQRAIETGSI